jgi:dihydrofolate synthase/folylpolyglutamate synthase
MPCSTRSTLFSSPGLLWYTLATFLRRGATWRLTDEALTQALARVEHLITREAELISSDPEERDTEFRRRLARTHYLMGLLGDPQNAYDTLHIGGTSGKGSIAMICESILRAAGLRVGTHTTPYLQTPLEKIRVDGTLVAADEAIALVDWIFPYIDQIHRERPDFEPVHYAEAWLGLALAEFARQSVDVGVVEVGMGGRFDSTNALTPRVSVISTVHYDHMLVLGDTLEEIAYHKAGIIKDEVPVVVGDLPPEALSVVARESRLHRAPMIRVGHDVRFEPHSITREGGRFTYHGLTGPLADLHLSLLGEHQFANAAAALAALELYVEATDTAIDETAIRKGLSTAHFAGRLEIVQDSPTVVLDGAHNEEKIDALVAALPALFECDKVVMLVGMLRTKNELPMLGKLASVADVVVTSAPVVKGKPASDPADLAALALEAGAHEAIAGGPPLEALENALALTGPNDLLCVTGSLYLIGEIRSHWYPVERLVAQRTMFPQNK